MCSSNEEGKKSIRKFYGEASSKAATWKNEKEIRGLHLDHTRT
jgi:hypothetical protein